MGSSVAKQNQNPPDGEDPLRDYATEINFPSNISNPCSNMLLAYMDGNYYPCIIVNRARNIANGYLVFFLHSQCETEIPSCNVIGNFKALQDCVVSFSHDGKLYLGKVFKTSSNEETKTPNFFINCEDQCRWISLPFIFLTPAQAKQLSC
ncbi:uncharacterized protein LOC109544436 [Dendroctonus ponderosae]|uniref:Uncharacterized protein n=1 Tax=Dendroctonus ponderosae TaxID=77166 RepID=A0AAR5QAA9_DENPD|nr:uncharacterized protein LOC109544436 [Dendroctonus ponderosae]KAH1016498.1 hypothetical protein HUJ04_007706 [Dendroctonus ponderosae]KAH1025843.1 hypothetical protein HUJ05_010488 [Dendroctonus ponderosae]